LKNHRTIDEKNFFQRFLSSALLADDEKIYLETFN